MKKLLLAVTFLLLFFTSAEAEVSYKRLEISFDSTISGSMTNATGALQVNKDGLLKQVIIVAPDLSTSTQLSVNIVNKITGGELYATGNISDNTTTVQKIAEDSKPVLFGGSTVNIFTNWNQDEAVDNSILIYFFFED